MLELEVSIPLFLALFFCFFPVLFSKDMVPRLFFAPFTSRGTLNDITPFNVSVAQSTETRGTSLDCSCSLFRELSASESSLSMAFSKSSRSSFDSEHFNATDVAFREIRAACVFKLSCSVPCFSIQYPLFAYFVHLFNIYCGGKMKTSLILKTLRACLHKIPTRYGCHISSICIRN